MRERAPGRTRPLAVAVLAAGRGSRLPRQVADVPKWFLTVGGSSIMQWQIDGFRRAADRWSRLLVVTGHRNDAFDGRLLSATLERPCELVANPMYASHNNWLSLHLALTRLVDDGWDGGVCVVNADLLLDPAVLARFLETAAGADRSLLAVDFHAPGSEEQMKVVVDAARRRALDIGKDRLEGPPSGEFIGLSTLAPSDLPLLRTVLSSFLADPGRSSEWYEGAYREAMRRGLEFELFPVDTGRWIEIDNADDLERAQELASVLSQGE
ncbi:MAG: NTP transferase domain-containing protein [Thermoleophilia bacterium]|nr:NTP transferase domain-containing protein [Thermoleophilia bacterium]